MTGRSIGLIVNPAAGRDLRRLTGGASVVDNYAKRRVAECVLNGLTATTDPPTVRIMPDRSGIAEHAIAESPDAVDATTLEMPIEKSAADTRRAAARFQADEVAAVVVLGGDGTIPDVAREIGSVPVIAVSTGTNNVVPSAVDGTLAGVAAALLATGAVSPADVTSRHGRVEARAETATGEHALSALASAEVSSRSFVGTRALLDPADLLGGVVSRSHPTDIGLAAVAGAFERVGPADPGGVALRLTDPGDAPRTARAVLAPGVTATVDVESVDRLAWGESVAFDIADGVVGADGERELELTDATVTFTPVPDGPRLVDVEATLAAGTDTGTLASAVSDRASTMNE